MLTIFITPVITLKVYYPKLEMFRAVHLLHRMLLCCNGNGHYLSISFCVWLYIGCISCGDDVTLNIIWRDKFELHTWCDEGSVRALGLVL